MRAACFAVADVSSTQYLPDASSSQGQMRFSTLTATFFAHMLWQQKVNMVSAVQQQQQAVMPAMSTLRAVPGKP